MPDRARITEVFPKPASSSQTLGFKVLALDMTDWSTRVQFDGKQAFTNPAGYVQGGFLAAMMDDTIGFLAGLKVAPRALPATLDLHTHFLRPVRIGPIEVFARIANTGRAILFAQAELFDSRGKPAARSSASLTINPVQALKNKLSPKEGNTAND